MNKTIEELERENAALRRFVNREFVRLGQPCNCYDHCEDDDEGVTRRMKCRKRNAGNEGIASACLSQGSAK